MDLRRGDEVLATEVRTIHALARNEWAGIEIAPELLAAFVMPNDPAVARVLKEASRALEASGRSGALDGYQQRSRTRVWELVAAVWAAICARRLTYAQPPASFETRGQKVRTPSDIEGQGLATCLDAALLFASCAEPMGLNPVMVFTKGHAFCGAWLQPQTLSTLTTDDAGELRKAVDQNEMVLFETTLAAGATPAPFAKAAAEARRRIAEEREGEFHLALDIRQARGRGVHPLAQVGAGSEPGATSEAGLVTVETPPELPGFDLGIQDERPPETAVPSASTAAPPKRSARMGRVASSTVVPVSTARSTSRTATSAAAASRATTGVAASSPRPISAAACRAAGSAAA